MARESNYSGHDHGSASGLAKRLCDRLHECLPSELSPRKHLAKNTCGAYVEGRNASLYHLYHYKDHVKVYLYGNYIFDISDEIRKLMPSDVLLETRPLKSLGTNAAKSEPCFFVLRTEDQSRSMGQVLRYMSEYRPKSSARSKTTTDTHWHTPSEAGKGDSSAAKEGNKISVLVDKYERSRRNREACVRTYGAVCGVCTFDFAKVYGEIGEGYIHVHHLTKLASLKGKAQRIDPVRDMLPVCPNCHEMLHQIDPPYTPEQLRAIIAEIKDKASSLRSSNSKA
jgi:hypothetical protein